MTFISCNITYINNNNTIINNNNLGNIIVELGTVRPINTTHLASLILASSHCQK